nr:TPA_asm: ND6 [Bombus melanopygus]
MNLNINLMLIMNYFYSNIFISPLKQLMWLIFYIIFMTMNILLLEQNISLNLFMLIIIFISGMLIMFSYFISLINKMWMKNNLTNLMILNLMIMILIFTNLLNNIKMIMKNLNFNYYKNKKINIIKKLYLKPNYYILIMFILFLIMMLFIMTKICYIKNKNLRTKKWKK